MNKIPYEVVLADVAWGELDKVEFTVYFTKCVAGDHDFARRVGDTDPSAIYYAYLDEIYASADANDVSHFSKIDLEVRNRIAGNDA